MRKKDLRSSTLLCKTSHHVSYVHFFILTIAIFSFSVLLQSCHKDITGPNSAIGLSKAYDTSKYMTGVHGQLLLKSHFHVIGDGFKLSIQGGHVYKAEKLSGKIVEDFGEYHPVPNINHKNLSGNNAGTVPIKTGNPQTTSGTTGTLNKTFAASYGWVAATQYYNNGSSPINYFSTTCTVPPAPIAQNEQTFAFWIGLENYGATSNNNSNAVIQPILAYGLDVWNQVTNNWNGGNEYQVFNVMDWGLGANENEVTTVPTTVASGTNVEFLIDGAGQTNGSYNYLAEVVNPANGTALCPNLTVTVGTVVADGLKEGTTAIPTETTAFNYAYIVLEDPDTNNIVGRTDYPNTLLAQSYEAMSNIVISTGQQPNVFSYPASIPWSVMNLGSAPQNHESAVIVNDDNHNTSIPGQVNLWFGPLPPPPGISGITTFSSTHTTGSGAITADPGQTVTVTLTLHNAGGFEFFDIGLTGGTTFIYGSGSTLGIEGSGSTYNSFVMPASGSVGWTCNSFQESNSGSTATISVK